MTDSIIRYVNHSESKFENGNKVRVMKRRFLNNGTLRVIGKDTRNLESQSLKVSPINEFISEA